MVNAERSGETRKGVSSTNVTHFMPRICFSNLLCTDLNTIMPDRPKVQIVNCNY